MLPEKEIYFFGYLVFIFVFIVDIIEVFGKLTTRFGFGSSYLEAPI